MGLSGIKLTTPGSVVGLATDYATGWNQIRLDTLKYLEAGRIHITLFLPYPTIVVCSLPHLLMHFGRLNCKHYGIRSDCSLCFHDQ